MKRKIAVLGGGAGSLFAVWDLMKHDPEAYDITVYQLGWRLGGKGASGRRMTGGYPRVEEHGLHFMFGFYNNVFRVIREAYLAAYPDKPADYFQRFFKGKDTKVAVIHFLDDAQSEWEEWVLPYPAEAQPALLGTPPANEHDRLSLILQNMWRWVASLAGELARTRQLDPTTVFRRPDFPPGPPVPGPPPSPLDLLRGQIDHLPPPAFPSGPAPAGATVPPYWEYAREFIGQLGTHPLDPSLDGARMTALAERSLQALDQLGTPIGHGPVDILARNQWRRVKGVIKFVTTVAKGLFLDLVIPRKHWFDLDVDFRAWMVHHGEDAKSPILLGLYDAVFATYSQLAAGAIVQAFTKAAFLFEGSAILKMQAGMGDTIFTPLYLALKQKGVKFEFFHRVESVNLSTDGKLVETIEMEQQVELTNGPYNPLIELDVDVGGEGNTTRLGCWPSEPLWDQIADADVDRVKGNVDLESGWTPREPARARTLKRCRPSTSDPTIIEGDFDAVLLGMSVAGVREVCRDLMAADPKFANHVNVLADATCATQAMQLWTVKDKTPKQPQPVVVPYVEPYDTVTDMSHLLTVEGGGPTGPAGITYLCSAIDAAAPAPRASTTYPATLRAQARELAKDWLRTRAPLLWKNLSVGTHQFDWNALYDPEGRVAEERFEAQWLSTPSNLSDRYVIPTPGSHRVRLKSNETVFKNLYLTGDWIKTSLSIGCLEATAMSGLQAARAISLELGTQAVPSADGNWIEDVTPRP